MTKKYSYILFVLLISVLFLFLSFPSEALKGKRSKDGRYVDHGDGTITDTKTNLMWTKKDSYADTRFCKDWNASKSYVSGLRTGGYVDWRLPTVKELKALYEKSKSNSRTYNQGKYGETHLDSIFATGAAYFYWTSETSGSCCARYVSFASGNVSMYPRGTCYDRGMRAVRR